jgi:hypothetical protein
MNENINKVQSKIKHFMGLFNAILGNASEVNIENISREFEPILIDGEIIKPINSSVTCLFY